MNHELDSFRYSNPLPLMTSTYAMASPTADELIDDINDLCAEHGIKPISRMVALECNREVLLDIKGRCEKRPKVGSEGLVYSGVPVHEIEAMNLIGRPWARFKMSDGTYHDIDLTGASK